MSPLGFDQLTAVDVSHVGVSLLTDPGAAVSVSWIERGTDSFTVHFTGSVAADTAFSYVVIEPL